MFGISLERVRQRRDNAIKRLRNNITDELECSENEAFKELL